MFAKQDASQRWDLFSETKLRISAKCQGTQKVNEARCQIKVRGQRIDVQYDLRLRREGNKLIIYGYHVKQRS